ncbi:hypothetical protein [Mycobacterium colombiense]|uniref:hypothetical protein n=1 Tax=Mycobacterium colombiense TaxID=339268 RepID=UPI0018C89CB7|nr:hypothetical protein [Mycobacterium colombiense]
MSTPAPGPGWWPASDGKWYPQRRESTFISHTHESLEAVLDEANRLTTTYGEQGWEIVGSSVQRTQVAHRFKEYDWGGEISSGASCAHSNGRCRRVKPRLPSRSRINLKTATLTAISSKGDS